MGGKMLKVYLAGKMTQTDRQAFIQAMTTKCDIVSQVEGCGGNVLVMSLVDPTSKPTIDIAYGDFVKWDIAHIQEADVVIVLDDAEISMKGTMAEMGMAYALGKRILVYTKAGFVHPFVAYMASLVVTQLDVLVKYLIDYLNTGDHIHAYYAIYGE